LAFQKLCTPRPKGAQRSRPAGFMADAGLRWCGATPSQPLTNFLLFLQSPCRRLLTIPRARKLTLDPAISPHRDAAVTHRRNDRGDDEDHGLAAALGARFLAGVVRKRLKLKLSSKKVDGDRVYRIAGASNRKTGARSSRPSTRTSCRASRSVRRRWSVIARLRDFDIRKLRARWHSAAGLSFVPRQALALGPIARLL
jgi:hypothetical protein